MSGHSKWARIHRQKGAADAKRGALFTKLGNAITIAAREGGGDLEANFKLRLTIDKAKASNMPKENIERAIKRGTGEGGAGTLEEVTYEGFGPGQTPFVIECVTDNRNRTSAEIKHVFSKHGGQMSGPNSVMWQFEKKGIIGIKDINDELELELIDAGATDIEKESGSATIYCQPNDLQKFKKLLEEKNIPIEFAEHDLIAKDKKIITDEGEKKKIQNFIDALEDQQDVNDYYTSAEM